MESQVSGNAGENPRRQREAEKEGPEMERPPFPHKTQEEPEGNTMGAETPTSTPVKSNHCPSFSTKPGDDEKETPQRMLGDGWRVEVGGKSLGVTILARSAPRGLCWKEVSAWRGILVRERLSESLDQSAQEESETDTASRPRIAVSSLSSQR